MTNYLSIAQAFADDSSNQVTIFDCSNLLYGRKIRPGTLVLTDTALSGSSNQISITLKDDSAGNLYRADALTTQSSKNTVGAVFYNEGIILITHPSLIFFGKNQFSISFNGEKFTHVKIINALCAAGMFNSSSNPNYQEFSPTQNSHDTAEKFTYITSVNVHDKDLNVIMKANLATPVIKRETDEFLVRLKYDF